MITLLAITPVFKNMSQNVQGAIIIVGVLQLFDWWVGPHPTGGCSQLAFGRWLHSQFASLLPAGCC